MSQILLNMPIGEPTLVCGVVVTYWGQDAYEVGNMGRDNLLPYWEAVELVVA